MSKKRIITSEYVSYGHPDKVADQVADALLDAYVEGDEKTRAGIEVMVKDNIVVLGGEVTSNTKVDVEDVARSVVDSIGYPEGHHLTYDDIKVINLIGKQSQEISKGVDNCECNCIGAGDQGFVVGYASNETKEYMPLGVYIARQICNAVCSLASFGPDVKTQVCIEYGERHPKILSITVSSMHGEELDIDSVRDIIKAMIGRNAVGENKVMDDNIFLEYIKNKKIDYHINENGEWHVGGSISDCGITGRKLVVDQYGGYCNIGGGAYCVDGDTEYIGEDLKWHSLSTYNGGKVGQWNNGCLEFVTPIAYHKTSAEKMYHFKHTNTIDMVLSENHDIVCLTSKKNIVKTKVKDAVHKHKTLADGFKGNIPVTFQYYGKDSGIPLTDNEIRLQVAFCADGTIVKDSEYGRINIKKRYKINRLEWLLKSTNTDYNLLDKGEYQNHYYTFIPPVPKCKSLYKIFKDCNARQMAIVAKEVMKWDGCDAKCIFRTTNKEDADFVQFLFQCVFGTASTIKCDDRVGVMRKHANGAEYEIKSITYSVYVCKHKNVSFQKRDGNSNISIEEFIPSDGNMYCFTVDSGMLLLRRNNYIFVTGNCGKDMSKVDRSAAYMARYLAKNIVNANLADEAKVELSYIISNPNPCAVNVELVNPKETPLCHLSTYVKKYIEEKIDLSPSGIINRFFPNGIKPIFFNTSRNGHYGFNYNDEFYPWEKMDISDDIKEYIKEAELAIL